jgi:hypothetical protein
VPRACPVAPLRHARACHPDFDDFDIESDHDDNHHYDTHQHSQVAAVEEVEEQEKHKMQEEWQQIIRMYQLHHPTLPFDLQGNLYLLYTLYYMIYYAILYYTL